MSDVSDSCSVVCILNAVNTKCAVSSRFPSESGLKKLSECARPIYNHLRQCAISGNDIESEGQLIAARCGLFETDLNLYTVCPFHRDTLGIAWQKKSTCQYPFHEGKAKPYRSFSLHMSKLVFSNLSTLVPVGSGICRKCIDLVHNLPDVHIENLTQTDLKVGNVDEKNVLSAVTQRRAAYSLQPFEDDQIEGEYFEHSDQFSSQESPHLSQTSNWSDENTTGLEAFNSVIQTISTGKFSPLKYQLQKPLQDITAQNRNYLQKKASQMVHSVLEMVAPGQSKELLKLIKEPEQPTKSNEESEHLMQQLTKIYYESSYNAVKDHTLSIMAGLSTKENLKNRIPRLTNYHINKVRAVTPDQIFQKVNEPPKKRQKMDQTKLEHCLSFFSTPPFINLCLMVQRIWNLIQVKK